MQLLSTRVLLLRPEVLIAIQKQLESVMGVSGDGMIYLAGERQMAEGFPVFFDESYQPRTAAEFRDLLADVTTTLRVLGFGNFVIEGPSPSGTFHVSLDDSPIAGAYGPSDRPVCHLFRGWIAGLLRRHTGREYRCDEVECLATGAERCSFAAAPS